MHDKAFLLAKKQDYRRVLSLHNLVVQGLAEGQGPESLSAISLKQMDQAGETANLVRRARANQEKFSRLMPSLADMARRERWYRRLECSILRRLGRHAYMPLVLAETFYRIYSKLSSFFVRLGLKQHTSVSPLYFRNTSRANLHAQASDKSVAGRQSRHHSKS